MKLKKELVIFPLLFLASIWMTDLFWPGIRPPQRLLEGKIPMNKKILKTDEEWKKVLSPEQFEVMRNKGTEKPFSGKYNDHYLEGVYLCAGCGTPLFPSNTKYDHGTGWPSFSAPVDEENLEYRKDFSHFMERIEVVCATCGAHLGHVFDDGPAPSRLHYCINSVTLDFDPAPLEEEITGPRTPGKHQTATFAAGCFWGVEDKFSKIEGVVRTAVGYSGGDLENPTYQQVCRGNTGHAEAVHIDYDPSVLSYTDLLDAFFQIHDPTQLNKQGPDIGSQYRSVIFYHTEEQKREAENMIASLQKSGRFKEPIVTQVLPAEEFFRAEEYHQKFYKKLSERKK